MSLNGIQLSLRIRRSCIIDKIHQICLHMGIYIWSWESYLFFSCTCSFRICTIFKIMAKLIPVLWIWLIVDIIGKGVQTGYIAFLIQRVWKTQFYISSSSLILASRRHKDISYLRVYSFAVQLQAHCAVFVRFQHPCLKKKNSKFKNYNLQISMIFKN